MFLQGLVFVNVSKEMSTKESRNEWWAAKWKCVAPHFPCFHSCFVCSISSLSLYVHSHPFISNAEGSYLKYKSIPFLPFQIQKYRKCTEPVAIKSFQFLPSLAKEMSARECERRYERCINEGVGVSECPVCIKTAMIQVPADSVNHPFCFCNFYFLQDPIISSFLMKWVN